MIIVKLKDRELFINSNSVKFLSYEPERKRVTVQYTDGSKYALNDTILLKIPRAKDTDYTIFGSTDIKEDGADSQKNPIDGKGFIRPQSCVCAHAKGDL